MSVSFDSNAQAPQQGASMQQQQQQQQPPSEMRVSVSSQFVQQPALEQRTSVACSRSLSSSSSSSSRLSTCSSRLSRTSCRRVIMLPMPPLPPSKKSVCASSSASWLPCLRLSSSRSSSRSSDGNAYVRMIFCVCQAARAAGIGTCFRSVCCVCAVSCLASVAVLPHLAWRPLVLGEVVAAGARVLRLFCCVYPQ
jgi:hypothetical protein